MGRMKGRLGPREGDHLGPLRALLRPFPRRGPTILLTGEHVYLRPMLGRDWRAWAELRADSRAFLEPWEPTWPTNALTRSAFRRRVRKGHRDSMHDIAYSFFVVRREDDKLLGGVTLSDIRRGVAQTCSMGYWVGERYAGQDYMTDAVRTVLPFVFERLGLHRVEAACLQHNEASRGLLSKVGFQDEGRARQYLRINGNWQDHVLYAILATDPRPTGEN